MFTLELNHAGNWMESIQTVCGEERCEPCFSTPAHENGSATAEDEAHSEISAMEDC